VDGGGAARPRVLGALRGALGPVSMAEQRALRSLLLKLTPTTDLIAEKPSAPRKRAANRD
jgi:hypothetical protein